ncbi:hypothetical protein R3P38DRAFT_2804647 [Favolaschia claudopus]|uniref:Uncharacterized protein n=1 Tax=Favolaschia claudopus TaxID=2862362 RepID=A0AAV9ZPH5_9AGAR
MLKQEFEGGDARYAPTRREGRASESERRNRRRNESVAAGERWTVDGKRGWRKGAALLVVVGRSRRWWWKRRELMTAVIDTVGDRRVVGKRRKWTEGEGKWGREGERVVGKWREWPASGHSGGGEGRGHFLSTLICLSAIRAIAEYIRQREREWQKMGREWPSGGQEPWEVAATSEKHGARVSGVGGVGGVVCGFCWTLGEWREWAGSGRSGRKSGRSGGKWREFPRNGSAERGHSKATVGNGFLA